MSVKFDALAILQRELRSRRVRGIVGVGAMSDTYNPFERTLRVTRGALELIEEFGFGVSVDTKSALITRDIDVLSAIGAAGGAIAKITVTTADDQLARSRGSTLPERYRAAFGDRYFCNSPRATENRALFRSLCKQHGLLWRMSDIIAAYKPSQPMGAQTSLF